MSILYLIQYVRTSGASQNTIAQYIQLYAPLPFPQNILAWGEILMRNMTLVLSTQYFTYVPIRPSYLLLTQTWTLQLQILFYGIAPFLLLLSPYLFVLIFTATIIMHVALTPILLLTKPYIYNMFLYFFFYAHTFLYGILIYKFTRIYKIPIYIHKPFIIGTFLLFLSQFFQTNHTVTTWEIATLSLLLLVTLPYISKIHIPFDAIVGKMAYPIFLSHLLIEKIVLFFLHTKSPISALTTYACTLLLALITTYLLQIKEEKNV